MGDPAPLSSYEAACVLEELFEKRRNDFDGHRFITTKEKIIRSDGIGFDMPEKLLKRRDRRRN